MTKRRPGIFDPWRQEVPPPPEPTQTLAVVDGPEETLGVGQVPTRFAGKRGGIVVWLAEAEPDHISAQAKTNILVALETLMEDTDLFLVFRNQGIGHMAETKDAHTKISDGPRSVFVQGDYEKSIDAICFAFREASRAKPSVEKYLISLGIRPYVR